MEVAYITKMLFAMTLHSETKGFFHKDINKQSMSIHLYRILMLNFRERKKIYKNLKCILMKFTCCISRLLNQHFRPLGTNCFAIFSIFTCHLGSSEYLLFIPIKVGPLYHLPLSSRYSLAI